MNTTAPARASAVHVLNPPIAPEGPAALAFDAANVAAAAAPSIAMRERDVYQVVVHQPAYTPHVAEAHWHKSNRAMFRALGALPCGIGVAVGVAGATLLSSAYMAATAVACVGLGCATVVFAPILVPTGVLCGLSAGGTLVSGGAITLGVMGVTGGVSAYQGTRAVAHASAALAQELFPMLRPTRPST